MDADPDPAIFVSDLQDINKFFFWLITFLFEGTFISFFKDKKSYPDSEPQHYQKRGEALAGLRIFCHPGSLIQQKGGGK